jgi:uncharacterized membrane protein
VSGPRVHERPRTGNAVSRSGPDGSVNTHLNATSRPCARAHKPGDPALSAYAQQRAHDVEDCIADAVTEFTGSMPFLHIHVIWFAA